MSALVVAAALPGGDPLAAALAAGETPSPDVLAAAAESDALGVGRGLALVSFVIAGLLVFAGVSQRTSLAGRTPLDDPPAVLINRAEATDRLVGYADPVGDTASGFMAFDDYRQWLRSRPLGPTQVGRVVEREIRPASCSGTAAVRARSCRSTRTPSRWTIRRRSKQACARSCSIRVDACSDSGRCRHSSTRAPVLRCTSWNTLFEAAGLSMSSFVEATPQWAPPDYADVRAAWTGPHPTVKDVTLRIEAAAYRGKPVFFDVIGPWTDPERMEPDKQSVADQMFIALIFTTLGMLIAAAGVLARRHIRTNRADRRGAWRVTAYLSIAGLLSWVLRASHSSNLEGEIGLFFRSAGVLALLGVDLLDGLCGRRVVRAGGCGRMRSSDGRVCSQGIFAIRASAAIC